MSGTTSGLSTVIVLDVEGTMGSLHFFREVLLPYSRARLRSFMATHRDEAEIRGCLGEVTRRTGIEDFDSLTRILELWQDRDLKLPPLKAIQGRVWEKGYLNGELRAHVYDDAVNALRRWARRADPVFIYSSGSALAQRLYFSHTVAGDLTPLISGHFDTAVGAKTDQCSYSAIAGVVSRFGSVHVFISDTAAELQAAAGAGFRAIQVRRPDFDGKCFSPFVTSFDELPF